MLAKDPFVPLTFGVSFSYTPNVCFVPIMPSMWNFGVHYTLTSIIFWPKSFFGPSSLVKLSFWTLKSLANFPARYTAASTITKTPNPRFSDLLSSRRSSFCEQMTGNMIFGDCVIFGYYVIFRRLASHFFAKWRPSLNSGGQKTLN